MFCRLVAFTILALALVESAQAHPITSGSLKRRAGGGPHYVIYTNKNGGQAGPPPASKLSGYNVVALSFLQTNKAMDKVAEWANFPPNVRSQKKKEYAAAGIKVIVSLFGQMDHPTTKGVDATKFANQVGDWVLKNGVDGVDVDYEDLEAMNKGDGKAEQWLITFTKTLRGKLPQGKYIISHAPVAPWFSPKMYKGGGYLKVHKAVGNMIDFYNIQFYNQGADAYHNCDALLNKSKFAGTSLFEISAAGVPMNKLVIGKPGGKGSATNGYMEPGVLAGCVEQASKKGWAGGVMAWEYPEADTKWIQTVKSKGGKSKASAPAGKGKGNAPAAKGASGRPARPK